MKIGTLIPTAGTRLDARHAARSYSRTRRALQATADLVVDWLERSRQRRALRRLDDRMLKDIGITRLDVARETGKPFWRP